MKITIVTGGTGSIALQTGLFEHLESVTDNIDIKVLVNAYDAGLSTGLVRKVCDGKILGPSDVRKNQTTRLKLQYPASPWNKFLDIRFTSSALDAKKYCENAVNELEIKIMNENSFSISDLVSIRAAIDTYFNAHDALNIDYNDFSMANIIYAGLARMFNNSLRSAARHMARILKIADNVILNDDESLFLGAISKSGIKVSDEADIVSWGKMDDPFVDVFFTDHNGKPKLPTLCEEAASVLSNSDLIILSAGTQWSSLIPTYASKGFKEVMDNFNGKVIMVMNNVPDSDSPGQTASDIILNIVPKYFKRKQISVILDKRASDGMCQLTEEALSCVDDCSFIDIDDKNEFTNIIRKTHSSSELYYAIGKSYFGNNLNAAKFMFDYDDTLIGRGNSFPKSSNYNSYIFRQISNRNLLSINTGNSIKAMKMHGKFVCYADGGINKYKINKGFSDDRAVFIECLAPDLILNQFEIDSIRNLLLTNSISQSKIENRGDVVISIKPIDPEYRSIVVNLLKIVLGEKHPNLEIKATGRTTIEISKHGISKKLAVLDLLEKECTDSLVYFGDEFDSGNDASILDIEDSRLSTIKVNNPDKTAFFLTLLLKKISDLDKLKKEQNGY